MRILIGDVCDKNMCLIGYALVGVGRVIYRICEYI